MPANYEVIISAQAWVTVQMLHLPHEPHICAYEILHDDDG